ncbi:MAG: threonine/serine dehydratase [Candidatus Bathyarchaeia archaeon]|jgi:threonine dehydratase
MENSVSLSDIQLARQRIFKIAYRTPLYLCPRLSTIAGANVYLKLETFQPIRVFKIRGATNKILKLSPSEHKRGFVAASSGNHGLAVSYVAHLVDSKATIVVPTSAVEEKVNAIEDYGAIVIKHGLFHDERTSKAMEIQRSTGAIFIPPFDDADIIAGQGTIGLEIVEDLPDVDTVIVPIGGGGLISGISVAVKNLRPSTRVIGVEPENASSMYQSIQAGKIIRLTDTRTIADGLATREPGSLTYAITRKNVDEIQLVSEEEIEKAVFTIFQECHLIVEPSSAAAVAALLKMKRRKLKEQIAVVISGGNISMKFLHGVLAKYSNAS